MAAGLQMEWYSQWSGAGQSEPGATRHSGDRYGNGDGGDLRFRRDGDEEGRLNAHDGTQNANDYYDAAGLDSFVFDGGSGA
jgi:hypothetical protein